MTNEEALNHAKQLLEEENWERRSYGKEYTELCAKALEKQIPKKAVDIFSYGIDEGAFKFGHCPTCGFGIAYESAHNFCPKCGQKLDWTEKEDNK